MSIHFFPDGTKLISIRICICIWNLESGELIHLIQVNQNIIQSECFMNNYDYILAFTDSHNIIRLMNLEN